MTSKCRLCKERKELNKFSKDKSRSSGVSSACKQCHKEISRKQVVKTYNISLNKFQELKDKQKGVCGICSLQEEYRELSIDHDHKTGQIRGLLCAKCNRGLGLLGDTKEAIEKALNYLTK